MGILFLLQEKDGIIFNFAITNNNFLEYQLITTFHKHCIKRTSMPQNNHVEHFINFYEIIKQSEKHISGNMTFIPQNETPFKLI